VNSGEFGAVDLNLWDGGGCGLGTGANDYSNTISGATPECELEVGDVVSTEGGSMNGPTTQGLNWFVITSYSGSTVTGVFVHSAVAPSSLNCHQPGGSTTTCTMGAYDPTGGADSGTRVILLTR
jgi:hypothetical protein